MPYREAGSAPDAKGTKVIFVDDSVTMRKVAEITFSDDNHELIVLSESAELVSSVKDKQPDVVILDSDMPGLNGYEACKQIRGEASIAQIPVLLLNGPSSPFNEQQGRDAKVTDHLDKPFETQAILDKVASLVKDDLSRPLAPPTEKPAPAAAAAKSPVTKRMGARKSGGKTVLGIPGQPAPGEARPTGSARQGAPASPLAPPSRPKAPPKAAPVKRPAPAREPPKPPPAAAKAPPPQPAQAAVAEATSKATDKAFAATAADLSPKQMEVIREVTREVVEQVVWEVVPDLAETIIKEELAKLLAE